MAANGRQRQRRRASAEKLESLVALREGVVNELCDLGYCTHHNLGHLGPDPRGHESETAEGDTAMPPLPGIRCNRATQCTRKEPELRATLIAELQRLTTEVTERRRALAGGPRFEPVAGPIERRAIACARHEDSQRGERFDVQGRRTAAPWPTLDRQVHATR